MAELFLYEELHPAGDWPKASGIAMMRFEISTWYPLWLCYVPEGEKFSKAIIDAGQEYLMAFGRQAEIAMIGSIPPGAEEFVELNGITLVQADWVQLRYVAVGRGGCQTFDEGFKRWKKVVQNA